MEIQELIQRIKKLKRDKNAVILAHYYTDPQIQDLADYLGDSLGLARQAARTDADIIVFCGVHFMAETASIISPNKKVLIPAQNAGCSLAESITGADIRKWREKNPNSLVVSYVNTTADVKAETDYCCTSSNALKIIESLPKDKKILFTPDKNLGAYICKVTGRDMEIWNGDCCVHERITSQMILDAHKQYPQADILIHPESNCSGDDKILKLDKTYFYSTAGIIKHAKESKNNQFIIATELGTIHKLQKDNPDKEFIPIHPKTICGSMKKITIQGLYNALLNEQFEVKVPQEIVSKAQLPIKRMLEIG